jgi:hypothetical protein
MPHLLGEFRIDKAPSLPVVRGDFCCMRFSPGAASGFTIEGVKNQDKRRFFRGIGIEILTR